jgi:anthranilate synthase/aminodeoxychorismate synthase-like glutamine amidotransferase
MILVIDNYDSFVHNLARYLQRLGHATVVVRNDEITRREVLSFRPDAIVLSPGPCTPAEAGCSLDLVRGVAGRIPILGVCLGHQTIASALGGSVVRADEPMHGRASGIEHTGEGLFAGLPNPLVVGRYHSLIVEEASLPSDLRVTARTSDGTVMALEHRRWPVFGVQFHPESILTECGHALLANFLRLAGIDVAQDHELMEMERPAELALAAPPLGPVTF